jgi:hypothetical protein
MDEIGQLWMNCAFFVHRHGFEAAEHAAVSKFHECAEHFFEIRRIAKTAHVSVLIGQMQAQDLDLLCMLGNVRDDPLGLFYLDPIEIATLKPRSRVCASIAVASGLAQGSAIPEKSIRT